MTDTKDFHLGDILSITDGRLLSPNHITGVGLLLSHMCGEPIMTHQMPLAADAMLPHLLAQHEWLTGLGPPKGADVLDMMAWLAWAVEEHGALHAVTAVPEAWGSHDPIEDWVNQGGDPSRVIQVEMPDA